MSISKTTCESAIARTIRALSPLCGKTFSVKDTSDPFYGVYEYTITATGKDVSALSDSVRPFGVRFMVWRDSGSTP